VWNQAHWHIVEPANECCDRLARHSTAKEAGGRRPHYEQAGLTSRRNDGITVAEQLLPFTLESRAATAYIDTDEEIVRTIRDRLAGPYAVAQTAEGSRHDGEARNVRLASRLPIRCDQPTFAIVTRAPAQAIKVSSNTPMMAFARSA